MDTIISTWCPGCSNQWQLAWDGHHHSLTAGHESLKLPGRIHSVAQCVVKLDVILTHFQKRPFHDPHHTISPNSNLVGEWFPSNQGQNSLAHNGVLFLDEFVCRVSKSIEVLRQPFGRSSPFLGNKMQRIACQLCLDRTESLSWILQSPYKACVFDCPRTGTEVSRSSGPYDNWHTNRDSPRSFWRNGQ